MDVFSFLEHEHESIRDLIQQLDHLPSDDSVVARALFAQLYDELKSVGLAEMEVVYPRLRVDRSCEALAAQGARAYASIERSLHELKSLDVDDERWWPAFEGLKEAVRAQIDDMEDSIFKRLRRVTRSRDWGEMGLALARIKERCHAA